MGKARLAAIAALSALALHGSAALCAEPMDVAHFRSAVIEALKKTDPKADIQVRSDFEIAYGKAGWIYLGNAYARYRENPAELDAILKQYVQVFQASQRKAAVERDKLIVLVRPRTYVDELAQRYAAAGRKVDEMDLPMHREVAGNLIALITLDEPQGYNFPAQEEVLKAFRGDRDAAWKLATANTHLRVGKIAIQSLEPGATALIPQDAGVAASLLSDPEVWSRPVIRTLAAHPVVFVGKTVIFVVDGSNILALEHLKAFASQHETDPNWVSPQLFVREGASWSVLPR